MPDPHRLPSSAAARLLACFRRHWRQLLAIHVAANAFSLLLLTPVYVAITGWLVLASGDAALTDEDILFHVLSPGGLLALFLVASLHVVILVWQHLAMVMAAYLGLRHEAPGTMALLLHLLRQSRPVFGLAWKLVTRTLAVAAPFLALAAIAFDRYLTAFDINYYLAVRPPEFWWVGGFVLSCLLVMALLLTRMFAGWLLAFPLLLLERQSPAVALRSSLALSHGRRTSITATLAAWMLVSVGLLGLVSMLVDEAVDTAVVLAGDSLSALTYLLGGVLVGWMGGNLILTFLSSAALSLLILYFFLTLASTRPSAVPAPSIGGFGARRWRIPAALLAAALSAALLVAAGVLRVAVARFDDRALTQVVAHRGASADAPENSLAAIELAIAQGSDWVEIDVHENRHGEIVVIHDRDLKRVGGVPLQVFDTPLAQLQTVDIGSWKDPAFGQQRVPSLQQVLALCRGRVGVLIELKYHGRESRLEERVMALVDAADMGGDEVMLMSLSYPGIRRLKSLRPEFKAGLLLSVAIGDVMRLEVDFLAVNARLARRAFILAAHRAGREVIAWTVDDPVSMAALMTRGADGVITNQPELAQRVRAQYAELELPERLLIQVASLVGSARPVGAQ